MPLSWTHLSFLMIFRETDRGKSFCQYDEQTNRIRRYYTVERRGERVGESIERRWSAPPMESRNPRKVITAEGSSAAPSLGRRNAPQRRLRQPAQLTLRAYWSIWMTSRRARPIMTERFAPGRSPSYRAFAYTVSCRALGSPRAPCPAHAATRSPRILVVGVAPCSPDVRVWESRTVSERPAAPAPAPAGLSPRGPREPALFINVNTPLIQFKKTLPNRERGTETSAAARRRRRVCAAS
ncbi:hypothetical protein EVAR_29419_1 [Eumeta japonica]|uniref:Uncharacterized protein n=1 Tax=Eumeta variegata TaxID=151549 RepID=A0A4C1VVY8_EUMVA|nr:hypothetical protein EVAR_29419_1 [Eumeta japonica]